MAAKFTVVLYIIIIASQFGAIAEDVEDVEDIEKSELAQLKSGTHISNSGDKKSSDHKLFAKYLASIRHSWLEEEKFGSGHFCDGTIIGRATVLTAGRCFYHFEKYQIIKEDLIRVVIGTINLYITESTTQIFLAKKYLVHPNFNYKTLNNDIGVIILDRIIKFDGVTSDIVKLPSVNISPLKRGIHVGWGSTDSSPAYQIHYVDMIILKEDECRRRHSRKVTYSFCAYNQSNISDTCIKHSGGPLFYNGAVAGIMSRSRPCGVLNGSTVFTNVYHYMDWITSNKNQASIIHYNLFALYISFMLYLTF